MKRALALLSLLGPIGLLIILTLYPSLDLRIDEPLFHFYVVTFSTFVAAVVAIFITLTLAQEGAPRYSLLATAFAAMGAIFLVHGRAQAFASQGQAEERHVEVQAPEGLAKPAADIALVRRVLDNLISNAFKYTQPGGHITLAAEQNASALLLSVADDGEVIPGTHAQCIFDKFTQLADKDSEPLRNGVGLGLAFCKLAVEAHGGRIWLDTEREKGSRFVFTLPLSTQFELL